MLVTTEKEIEAKSLRYRRGCIETVTLTPCSGVFFFSFGFCCLCPSLNRLFHQPPTRR